MTTPFKHENIIKIAGVLGVAPELRLTANGNSVATLIVYTNYILRNDDGSDPPGERAAPGDRVGMHAAKAARLLTKGSQIRIQGRMSYPTWKDKQNGATRYGAEIVARRWITRARTKEMRRGPCSPLSRLPHPSRSSQSLAPSRPRPSPSAAAARRRRPPRRRSERRVGTKQHVWSPLLYARAAHPRLGRGIHWPCHWRLRTTVCTIHRSCAEAMERDHG